MKIILILAGGTGTRFGDEVPKQYHLLRGRPAVAYVIQAAKESAADAVLVAAAPEYADTIRSSYGVDVVPGGSTRNQSIQNGIDHISRRFPDCDKLIVVDGVTATVQPKLFNEYFQWLEEYDLVITALHIPVSLTSMNGEVLDRDQYYLAASPDAVRFPLIREHFSGGSPVNSISQQMPLSLKRRLNFDFHEFWKLIYPQDAAVLEALLEYQERHNEE